MSLEPISLRLQGRGGWLHPGSFLTAVQAFWGVLHNLDTTFSGQPSGSVNWEISAFKRSGPATVVFIGHLKTPPKDVLPEIKKAVLEGVRTLSNSEMRPRNYSDLALVKIMELAEQYSWMDEIAIVVDDEEQPLRPDVVERIKRMTDNDYETIGSITGKLVSLTVGLENWFQVCNEVTATPVNCRFGQELLETAKQHLGKRALVYGTLRRNFLDEPILMQAQGIEAWPEQDDLPNVSYLSGRFARLTCGLRVGEYISRVRE